MRCKWFYLSMVSVTEKYTDFSKTNAVCSILSRFNTCISLIVSVESAINKQSKFGDRTFRNFIIKKKNTNTSVISRGYASDLRTFNMLKKGNFSVCLRGICHSVTSKSWPNATTFNQDEIKYFAMSFFRGLASFLKSIGTLFCWLIMWEKEFVLRFMLC